MDTASPIAAKVGEIDVAMQKLYPETYAELAAPSDVAGLPAAAAELYRWRDGAASFLVRSADEDALDWLSAQQALDVQAHLSRLAKAGETTFDENLFPMFGGDGDFLCIDVSKPDPKVVLVPFFHEEPELRTPKTKLHTLLGRTLSAIKKGKWRGGFEGSAGEERRAKLDKRFASSLKRVTTSKFDVHTTESLVHTLADAKMYAAALELAEAASAAQTPSNRSQSLSDTLSSVRFNMLSVAFEQGQHDRVLELVELVRSKYGFAFETWRYAYRATVASQGSQAEPLPGLVQQAHRAAKKEALQIRVATKRGHRYPLSSRKRAASDLIEVARMWTTIAEPDRAEEAFELARAVPGLAAWVAEQLEDTERD